MKNTYSCLMFHEFVQNEVPISNYSLSYNSFGRYLSFIKEKKMKVFTFKDLIINDIESFGGGCILTFDDGHKSNILAAEMMAKQNLRGVFYVVKELTEQLNNDYMDEKDLLYIHSLGHEIGVHGKSHTPWNTMDTSVFINDFAETKDWLESLLEESVISCSAPCGGINSHVYKTIEANFPKVKYIRSSKPGLNRLTDRHISSKGLRYKYKDYYYQGLCTGSFFCYLQAKMMYYVKKVVKAIIHRVHK